MTYKQGFKPLLIEKSKYLGKKVSNKNSDCGWGCTIRAFQMLIANTLLRFGICNEKLKILKLFDDNQRGDPNSPFSIQNIAFEGLKEFDKYPGEWYGVNTASSVFQKLSDSYDKLFKMIVFNDGNLICSHVT